MNYTRRMLLAVLALLAFAAPAFAQDKKISELTAATSATYDDLTVLVDDPAGTPTTKKITVNGLLGWQVNAQTGTTYTVLTTDDRKLVTFTNGSSIAVTLPQANSTTFKAGYLFAAQNRGAGTVTITPTTSTIDGAASLALSTDQGAFIFSDGTNYFTMRGGAAGAGGSVTASSTTTFTNKDLTGASNTLPAEWGFAVTDETTAITTGTAKITFRMPFAMTVTAVRCNLNTVSSSGAPAIDINEAGASIFSTTLTIDASEKTSVSAATPAVISDSALADDAEITVDIDTAGTGAKGLKCTLIGTR
jgi:hypothetical protein